MIYSENTGNAPENSKWEIMYDVYINRLLSDKTVLAFILSNIVDEFADVSVQEIAEGITKGRAVIKREFKAALQVLAQNENISLETLLNKVNLSPDYFD